MLRLLLLLAIAGLPLRQAALAADGVIEINHFTALAGGVNGDLALDPPGYPVTITSSGSYRVTGHMPVPNANTDGIVITALRTTIDLGGFEIRGPNQKASVLSPCTAAGSGVGVRSGLSVTVHNGRVSGMGLHGLVVGPGSQIERVQAAENCGIGLEAGTSSVVLEADSRLNNGSGIRLIASGQIRDSIAMANGGNAGIVTGQGSVVADCVATANTFAGIEVGAGSVVTGSVASGNGTGVSTSGASTLVHNSLSANAGQGVSSLQSDGIGGNTSTLNGVAGIAAGVALHCNALDGAASCPP